jgi:hypothetical protein
MKKQWMQTPLLWRVLQNRYKYQYMKITTRIS